MPSEYPTTGTQGRTAISITGTGVQLPGAAAKTVMVSAKQAITNLTGGASTDNTDTILVGIGAAPSFATAYAGIPLRPGETQIFQVHDLSDIWINGLANDAVTWLVMY